MYSANPPTLLATCFAQLRFDPELMLFAVLLIVMIVAGGIVVVRVRRWRAEEATPAVEDDLLTGYRALVERGELDPQEFERIKARLQGPTSPPETPT